MFIEPSPTQFSGIFKMADEVKKTSEELDHELDSMIDKMIKKNEGYKYTEGLTEENWEKVSALCKGSV